MNECILSNKELENATKLMKIAIEHFSTSKPYTKEDEEKLIDSLLKSLDRLKQNVNEPEILKKRFNEELQEYLKNNDGPIHPSSWDE